MTTPRHLSRRDFLGEASCAAVGTTALLSSLLSLRLTLGAASASQPPASGYRALICLFLNGGNDSFNMLVPREQSAYDAYAAVRKNLVLPRDGTGSLLPISVPTDGLPGSQGFSEFGVHPDLPTLQQLFAANNAAFVANVGTLIEPMTVAEYYAGTKPVPPGLFSHADEVAHWQTFVPQVRGGGPKGWAGRMADVMDQCNAHGKLAMNLSLSGNNILQTGASTVPYITDSNGAVQLTEYGADPTAAAAIDSFLSQQYRNLYQQTLAQRTAFANATALDFQVAVDPITTTTTFPDTQLGQQLEMVCRVLAARTPLGMERQIFFVRRGGWDHHSEVLNSQSELFTEVDAALAAYWAELGVLGLQDDVVLFSASDFARTLTSNGQGSDHAWGGNHFCIGGPVDGGRIYGDFPDLTAGNALDLGRGRLLPSTPVDAYGAELAAWFGVPTAEMTTVFPNAENFFDPVTTPYPLGMLG